MCQLTNVFEDKNKNRGDIRVEQNVVVHTFVPKIDISVCRINTTALDCVGCEHRTASRVDIQAMMYE